MCVVVLFILIKYMHKCVNNHCGLIADNLAGPGPKKTRQKGMQSCLFLMWLTQVAHKKIRALLVKLIASRAECKQCEIILEECQKCINYTKLENV